MRWCIFCFPVLVLLAIHVQPAQAQSGSSSDVININIADNPQVLTIPETSPESTIAFNTNQTFGTPASSPGTDITLPGVFTVLFADPATEPPQPGETPIVVTVPGFGTFNLSDAVVNTAGSTQVPPQLLFMSDLGNTDLQQVANNVANATNLTILTETGSAQDISAHLGALTAYGSPQVLLTSDVVPEPASLSLLAAGAGGLLLLLLRRRTPAPTGSKGN
jgi:hypothetical protein